MSGEQIFHDEYARELAEARMEQCLSDGGHHWAPVALGENTHCSQCPAIGSRNVPAVDECNDPAPPEPWNARLRTGLAGASPAVGLPRYVPRQPPSRFRVLWSAIKGVFR